ncbi:MAG: hypothetical protein AABY32_01885 [Nanoarchaeota archaeon]
MENSVVSFREGETRDFSDGDVMAHAPDGWIYVNGVKTKKWFLNSIEDSFVWPPVLNDVKAIEARRWKVINRIEDKKIKKIWSGLSSFKNVPQSIWDMVIPLNRKKRIFNDVFLRAINNKYGLVKAKEMVDSNKNILKVTINGRIYWFAIKDYMFVRFYYPEDVIESEVI